RWEVVRAKPWAFSVLGASGEWKTPKPPRTAAFGLACQERPKRGSQLFRSASCVRSPTPLTPTNPTPPVRFGKPGTLRGEGDSRSRKTYSLFVSVLGSSRL